ncbi:hypothetical protein BV25DRAFT_1796898 [Artomyces pyxidatus]|uniref:Uncharacterized protein n=1 Tax=Artomyces pyxidatus TaxID=48021 RepID=A0ACB8TDI8_9AGAM|nr:hypothetical protein BV25DRAFT_1796898 [Artomyces pyxidatus]
MDGWEDRLHTSFIGEHVLFTGLRLTSLGSFLSAAVLTIILCSAERRALTFALARQWNPWRVIRRSRLRTALWRTGLYWVVTLLRLLYMLISMTFHVWLIAVIVTSLSVGQFIIECLDQPHSPGVRDSYRLHEPLLSPTSPIPSDKPYTARPRAKSKSKPAHIFIHPNESNIARADAVAVEMGLHGSTDRVKSHMYPEDAAETPWQQGKGRDLAREMMGGSRIHSRTESQQKLFRVGDSGSDSSDQES